MRVYKYELSSDGSGFITLPAGAEVLRIDWQGPRIYLWALVQKGKAEQVREFLIAGTGQPIPSNTKFINSFMSKEHDLVFHCFEVLK